MLKKFNEGWIKEILYCYNQEKLFLNITKDFEIFSLFFENIFFAWLDH